MPMSGHLEAEDFVAAHPGHGRQPVDGEEPVAGGGAQEQEELVIGQGDARSGDQSHIAADQPPSRGVGERTSDDQVDLIDGLGGEPAPFPGVEQGVVEGLDLLVAQPPDADFPRAGRTWCCTCRS